MYFAYFDESGDSGLTNSPSRSFVLSTILVKESDWLSTLDKVIEFRRSIYKTYGIHSRVELKAQWLIQNKGTIRKYELPPSKRMAIYRDAMIFQRECGSTKTFAVMINKNALVKRTLDVRELAWRMAIERLQSIGRHDDHNIHILPDEGHGEFIRKKLRAMRRHHRVPSAYGTESLQRNAERLVEDSSDRRSQDSYFIQLADLNAYAAFAKIFPGRHAGPELWDELQGDCLERNVAKLTGDPTLGIKVFPPLQ